MDNANEQSVLDYHTGLASFVPYLKESEEHPQISSFCCNETVMKVSKPMI